MAERTRIDMIALPPETEQLARLVASSSGTTPEQVLKEAVEARARELGVVMPAVGRKPGRMPSVERMMAISERFANRPVVDPRPADEIIGYDEFGVPH
jgi:antitoxin VapB